MGNKRDGENPGVAPNEEHMAQAGILETAFQEFATGCEFSKEEKETLEKLDDILKNADIIVNKDGSSATIATSNYSYKVGAYPTEKPSRDRDVNYDPTSPYPPRNYNMVGDNGNEDAKILGKAVQLLGKDREGLSKADIEMIEKLDAVLKNADIVIGENGEDISIIQSNGVVHSTNSGKSR